MDWKTNPSKIICLDNGGYSVKYSLASIESQIHQLQNCKFTDK